MKQSTYPRAFFIVYFLCFSILVCATPVHPRIPNSGALGHRSLASTRTYQSFYPRGHDSNGTGHGAKSIPEIKASSPTQSQDPPKWEKLEQRKTEILERIKKSTERAETLKELLPSFPIGTHETCANEYVTLQQNTMLSWRTLLGIAKLELKHYPNDLSAADIKKTLTGAQNWHKAIVGNWNLTKVSSLEEFKTMPGKWEELKRMMKEQGHDIDSV